MSAEHEIVKVGDYQMIAGEPGVWFLTDSPGGRIRSTILKDGPGRWKGVNPAGRVLVKEIDDDTEDPHLVMAQALVDSVTQDPAACASWRGQRRPRHQPRVPR